MRRPREALSNPTSFRSELTRVPPMQRDAWLDEVLDLREVPDDGPSLPRECVPYLPCSVNTLLDVIDDARVSADDVFVDLGAGVGRAAVAVRLLTGAAVVGVEIQPQLVEAARALTSRANVSRVTLVEGDVAELAECLAVGTVFFLYCPFSGERLQRVLARLEAIAHTRPIRICCVDLPLPECPWLTLAAPPKGPLAVYRGASSGAGSVGR